MSTTQFAIVVGLVLGTVAVFGGFGHFVVVALFAAVALVIGRVIDGRIDLRALAGRATSRN